MRMQQDLREVADRLISRARIIGIAGLAIGLLAWFQDPHQFFRSYLLAYVFWMGLTLGSLSLLLLHHMVGGAWGFVIRRILEASTRTILVMGALFIPVLLGITELYEWSHAEVVAQDALLQKKSAYLNIPFFVGRSIVYFALWIGLAYFVNKLSVEQDKTGDPGITRRLQLVSGPGLVVYGGTVTFASIDWVMSLEPHWFSTIYGLFYIVGFGLSAMAFSIIALRWLRDYEPLDSVVTDKNFHDLGNLSLAFIMLWAYLGFSQYLITWSANLPEEIPWYLNRMHGGWQYLAIFLIVFHFALPFMLLLSRTTKRKAGVLAKLALAVLVLRVVDLFFLIVPATGHDQGLNVVWSDAVLLAGLGGIWVWTFLHKLKDRALLPIHDPRLQETFGAGSEGAEHV